MSDNVTSDAAPSTPASTESHTPDIVISDDSGYDIATMRELSAEDPVEEALDASEVKGVSDDNEERVPNRERQEREEPDSDSDESEEDDDTGRSEDYDSDDVEDVRESSSDEEVKTVKYTDADGKEHDIPRDVEFTIKVNGKKETLTLQDALNTASAGINFQRENAALGRKRKKFEQEETAFHDQKKAAATMAEQIMGTEDPYDFAYLMGKMNGEDGEQVFRKMLDKTVEYMRKWSNMTPQQRELEKENRKLRHEKRQRDAQDKIESETRTARERRQQTEAELESVGFTLEDFNEAIEEIKDLNARGEELGFGLDEAESIDEDSIIAWMVDKDIYERLETTVESVNPKALDDEEFVERARKVLYRVESLHGKLSDAEMTSFIKSALEGEGKAISESLSKKARKRSNSKRANSHKQDEGIDVASVEELLEGRRNLPMS